MLDGKANFSSYASTIALLASFIMISVIQNANLQKDSYAHKYFFTSTHFMKYSPFK